MSTNIHKMAKLNNLLLAVLAGLFSACNEKNDDLATVRFRLTDAPAAYDALFIDVQGIEVHTSAQGWTTLNSSLGIIDLLTLVNGHDTLIASGQFSGKISQIRLLLGYRNSIVVDGISYNLDVPSGESSGLKINLHQLLQAGQLYEWIIDFDAARSVIKTGGGLYKLKPVLRAYASPVAGNLTTGSIHGVVSPVVLAPVCAINANNDTFCTMTGITGNFLIQGLIPDVYTVVITPDPPLTPQTRNNISVAAGQSTDVGTIGL